MGILYWTPMNSGGCLSLGLTIPPPLKLTSSNVLSDYQVAIHATPNMHRISKKLYTYRWTCLEKGGFLDMSKIGNLT